MDLTTYGPPPGRVNKLLYSVRISHAYACQSHMPCTPLSQGSPSTHGLPRRRNRTPGQQVVAVDGGLLLCHCNACWSTLPSQGKYFSQGHLKLVQLGRHGLDLLLEARHLGIQFLVCGFALPQQLLRLHSHPSGMGGNLIAGGLHSLHHDRL